MMDEQSELELSREQHRAVIAVDVIRLVNPSEGTQSRRLYDRAVAELTRYLEPAVPDPEEYDGDQNPNPNSEEYRK